MIMMDKNLKIAISSMAILLLGMIVVNLMLWSTIANKNVEIERYRGYIGQLEYQVNDAQRVIANQIELINELRDNGK